MILADKKGRYWRENGTSLIEVLISLLVISIGLLGVAALQVSGLKDTHNASLRSMATLIASDMAERMRANPQGLAANNYAAVDTDNPPADPGCNAAPCDAAQIADSDAHQWTTHFRNLDNIPDYVPDLPKGRGTVGLIGTEHVITITWEEQGVVDPITFTTSVQP